MRLLNINGNLPLGIRGQLVSRAWEDTEGNKHPTVEIRARELELLGSGNGHVQNNSPAEIEDNSDIPF